MTKEEYELLAAACESRAVSGKYRFVPSRAGRWVTITVILSDQRILGNANSRKVRDIYGGYHLSNAMRALDNFEREVENPELQVSPSRYDPSGLDYSGMFTTAF